MSSKKQRPWSVDLALRENDVGYDTLQKLQPPPGLKRVVVSEKQVDSLDSSATATSSAVADAKKKEQQLVKKKQSKAMSIAVSPGKQILMNGFMMYMSGRNLNIFSISITSMAMLNPLKGLLGLNSQFRQLEDPDGKVDLTIPKLIFLALNLVWFGVGLWKMGTMRLLPTTSADWSGTVVWKEMMEISSVPPS